MAKERHFLNLEGFNKCIIFILYIINKYIYQINFPKKKKIVSYVRVKKKKKEDKHVKGGSDIIKTGSKP